METKAAVAPTAECRLLGEFGGFGWWLQGLLAVLSFASLVAKRLREKPRRRWSVFFFDASKQASGALLLHMLNLGFASIFASLDGEDPCEYYWLNIMVDTTLGVYIQYLMLRFVQAILKRPSCLNFGFYGTPPRARACLVQAAVWQVLCIAMKAVVATFMLLFKTPLALAAGAVLSGLDPYPNVKLAVVMVFTPLIMNTFQYWVTDNFIKKNPGDIPVYTAVIADTLEGPDVNDKDALELN